MVVAATDIDRANEEFWNELCGSQMARSLGITDHSVESLERFDRAYLDFYPYLMDRIRPERFAGSRVLEVGLGYGTVGQKIAAAGADYLGLDIAQGPVNMMNHRLQLSGLPGRATRGNILHSEIDTESVGHVVSIGCFHHTGDVQRCLDETYRVLKPGGTATLMLYNQFSYRQWGKWPLATLRALLHEWRVPVKSASVGEAQRRAYDADTTARAAAETVFLSTRQIRRMMARFSSVQLRKENCNGGALGARLKLPFQVKVGMTIEVPRPRLLRSLGRLLGLDVYIAAVK